MKKSPALDLGRVPADLPEMLRVAKDAGGLEAALGLTRELGGQLVYIPHLKDRVRDDHPLVMAAGRAAADAIMGAFGRSHHRIPTGARLRRYLAFELLQDENISTNYVVKQTGLDFREVQRLRARLKQGFTPAEALELASRARPRVTESAQIDMEDWLKRR